MKLDDCVALRSCQSSVFKIDYLHKAAFVNIGGHGPPTLHSPTVLNKVSRFLGCWEDQEPPLTNSSVDMSSLEKPLWLNF